MEDLLSGPIAPTRRRLSVSSGPGVAVAPQGPRGLHYTLEVEAVQQASGRAAEPCAGKPGRPSRRAVVHCETCVFSPALVLVSSARSRNELARPEQGGSLHAASLGYAAPARARFSPSGILEDLLPQLQHTLAALADVECRYEAVREELEASPKPKQPRTGSSPNSTSSGSTREGTAAPEARRVALPHPERGGHPGDLPGRLKHRPPALEHRTRK